jgi:hypothetical protein
MRVSCGAFSQYKSENSATFSETFAPLEQLNPRKSIKEFLIIKPSLR